MSEEQQQQHVIGSSNTNGQIDELSHQPSLESSEATAASSGNGTVETFHTAPEYLGDLDLVNDSADAINNSDNDEVEGPLRQGTISSARFNMWSTMVGGGSLSLPLAFSKSGNILGGPLLLLATALITEFCFRILTDAARTVTPVSVTQTRPSKDSYESVAAAAFGAKMHAFGTVLVTLMCFFGIVGYAVLLRDMLEPISDAVFHSSNAQQQRGGESPSLQDNLVMFTVVLAVTPLCTLQTLTALKKFGAASMCSILILGLCILFRSLECTFGRTEYAPFDHGWSDGFQLFPKKAKDVLDVLPLYISCYVCHYNLMPVHNELQQPSGDRVRHWLRSTVWGSTLFYLILGIAGSAYGACTPGGSVHGNILLDFPEDDPLLLVGRMCLAVTITLAFPMLTIPARDILIRTAAKWKARRSRGALVVIQANETEVALREPLLDDAGAAVAVEQPPVAVCDEEQPGQSTDEQEGATETALADAGTVPLSNIATPPDGEEQATPTVALLSPSLGARLLASIVVFWTGAAVAGCVSSIDIVWDLLGSSLSIMLSHLIPCGSFIVISKMKYEQQQEGGRSWKNTFAVGVAWALIFLFTPLMFVSTANAVYDTFFE